MSPQIAAGRTVRCLACRLVQFDAAQCRRCRKALEFLYDLSPVSSPASFLDLPADEDWIIQEKDQETGSWKSRRFHQMVSARIGGRVKRLRKAKGISQAVLACRAGVIRVHVTKVEAGIVEPRLRLIYRLAEGLEVTPVSLVVSDRWLAIIEILEDPFLSQVRDELERLRRFDREEVLQYAKKLVEGKARK